MRYLLDTNAASEAARIKPHAGLMGRLHTHQGQLAISALTLHELRYGLQRMTEGARKEQLRDFVSDVLGAYPVLEYDSAAADWHAKERARLEMLGLTPSFVDGQLAATAAVRGLILVTANVRDFVQFKGLAVENWLR